MTDRKAIERLNQIQMQCADVRHFDAMFEAVEIAKEALQEREKRSKGCPVCDKWEDANFCSNCGRPLKGADND